MNFLIENFVWIGSILIFLIILFLSGIKIIRPAHRGLIERLGKYIRFVQPGFHWIIPVIEKMYQINITGQTVNAEPQETAADGQKRAEIKKAEGIISEAEGWAQAIKLVIFHRKRPVVTEDTDAGRIPEKQYKENSSSRI